MSSSQLSASSEAASPRPVVKITDLPDDVVLRIFKQLGFRAEVDARALRRMGPAYAAAATCTRWHRVFMHAITSLDTAINSFETRFPATRDTLSPPHVTWLCRNAPNLTKVKLTLFNATAANELGAHEKLAELSIMAEEAAPALRRIAPSLTALTLAYPSMKTLRMLSNPQIDIPTALEKLHLEVTVEQLPLLRAIVRRVGATLQNMLFVFGLFDQNIESDARKEKLEQVRAFIKDVSEAAADEMPELTMLTYMMRALDQDKMVCFPDLAVFEDKIDEVQHDGRHLELTKLATLVIYTEGPEVSPWIDAAAKMMARNTSLLLDTGGDMMLFTAPLYNVPHPARFHTTVRVKSMIAELPYYINGGYYFMQKKLPVLTIPERATIVRFKLDDEYHKFVLDFAKSCRVEELRLFAPLSNVGLRVMAGSSNVGADAEVMAEVQKMTAMLVRAADEDADGTSSSFQFLREMLPHMGGVETLVLSFELVLLARSHRAEVVEMLELVPSVKKLTLMMPTFMPLGDALKHGEVALTQDFLLALPDFLDVLTETLPALTKVRSERLSKAISWTCPTKGRLRMFEDVFDAMDRFEAKRDEVCVESLRVLVEVFKMATPVAKLK